MSWEVKPLGDVCPIVSRRSSHFAGVRAYYSTGEVGTEGELGTPQFVDFKNKPSRAGWMPVIGDVGFARMKGTQKVVLVDDQLEGALFSTGFCFLEPSAAVHPRFLFYYCTSSSFQEMKDSIAGDGIMGGAGNTEVSRISFAFPSLKDQAQIVSKLDAAVEALAEAQGNTERNLANADGLFSAYLDAAFKEGASKWAWSSIGDVCDVLNGFAFKSGDAITSSGTQVVRIGNLYRNTLDLSRSPVFYPDSFATEYQNYLLKEGDIVMSLTGTVGKTDYGYSVRIPPSSGTLLMNQRLMKIAPKDEAILNRAFLLYYLLSPSFLTELYKTSNGTRQANLSSRTIQELQVPVPPLQEQLRVAANLEVIQTQSKQLETTYQQKLTELAGLKKAVLGAAFRGEL